jgi:hypothetical protein
MIASAERGVLGKGGMAEPGQWDGHYPSCHLVWAVTDGDSYVIHYEALYEGHTNSCVLVAFHGTDDQRRRQFNGVYLGRLLNYKAFIEYEAHAGYGY